MARTATYPSEAAAFKRRAVCSIQLPFRPARPRAQRLLAAVPKHGKAAPQAEAACRQAVYR